MIGLCDRMRDHNFCTCNFQINIILHMHVKLHGKYSNYVATVARTYCWSSACIPLGKGRLSRKVKFTGLWPRTPGPAPPPQCAVYVYLRTRACCMRCGFMATEWPLTLHYLPLPLLFKSRISNSSLYFVVSSFLLVQCKYVKLLRFIKLIQ